MTFFEQTKPCVALLKTDWIVCVDPNATERLQYGQILELCTSLGLSGTFIIQKLHFACH